MIKNYIKIIKTDKECRNQFIAILCGCFIAILLILIIK